MGKRIWRLLSIILALMLAVGLFAGCSGSGDKAADDPAAPSEDVQQETEDSGSQTDEPTGEVEEPEPALNLDGRTIQVAAWWDPTPQEGASEWADNIIERTYGMEQKYNFKMEYLNIPIDQYVEKFSASTLAGDPFADIAWLQSQDFFPGLVNNGFCYPVSDLGVFDFEEEKWNQFSLDVGTYDGKTYGFSTGGVSPVGGVFWNKTLFEREGLPNLYELQNNDQWTWDKMLEITQKATKDTDGDGVIDQWGMVGDFRIVWAFIESNNGKLYEMVDNKPVFTLNQANAIEALQFVQDLINVHKVMPIPPEGSQWDWPISEFQSGKYAMTGAEWWQAERYQTNMEDDYGFVVYPKGPKGDKYVHVTVQANLMVMPATVKNPEAVAAIWDEYTDPFSDDDPDAWRIGIENNARDAETVHTIEMIREGAQVKSVMSQPYLMGNVGELGWKTLNFIGTGQKTAQVAVEEIAQQAQAALNDAFKIAE